MRLLVVDHNALEPTNRRLYDTLMQYGDITLRLIVPSRWFNTLRKLTFTPPDSTLGYDIFPSRVFFPTRTHRLIYRSLSTHVKEFQPDILYMNAEPENFQTFQAAVMCSSGKPRLVFSSWRNIDHLRDGYPYRLEFLHRAIERYVLRRAAHGIVFNREAKNIFSRHGYDTTTFIPPHVDTELFGPAEHTENSESFVVGYVGRMAEQKGIDLLLRAVAALPGRFRAILVGDGPDREAFRQLAEVLGIAYRVEFHPPVRQEQLPELYGRMDVLVLPSRTEKYWKEQFGRVLIEAMACGIPVVGSSSGEIPEVIGNAGLIFKEGSVEGLRLELERLAENRTLWRELRARGLKRVRDRYSVECIAQQMHDLFLRLHRPTADETVH